MSNIHVLDMTGGAYRLVFHIATPAGNNASGVAWSTALVNSGLGGTTVMKSGDGTAGTIAAAELSAIQAGTTIEIVQSFRPSADFEGASGTAQKAFIDALYSAITTAELAELAQQLNRWGLTLT